MNDLALLDTHGPAAAPLRDDVLAASRAALLAEISGENRPPALNLTPTSARARPRRRGLVAGLIAASTAGALMLGPSLLGLTGSGAIALAPCDPITFPLTPTEVPAGLGDAVFELDEGFMAARYGAGTPDGLSVTTDVASIDFWSVPDDARAVDVGGQDATLFEGVAHQGTTATSRTVSVAWRGSDGDWTAVTGRGRYAEAGLVEAFAESLTDRPQPVSLSLGLAPEGWSVDAYKEDRVLMLSPDGGPADTDLTVSLLDEPTTDFAGEYGVERVSEVTVQGGTAQVAQNAEGWILLGRTRGGQDFSLSAPTSFTREQLVAVADEVTYTR